ncbi:MAG TPA: hypothetical protein VK188_15035 [Holophaga sp.]|nr:hypothetical protein [Holophaga sp.]
MSLPAPLHLDSDHLRFLTGGISINAASSDGNGVPSLCRAIGCRVKGGGSRLVLFLSEPAARTLLEDIQRSGQIAAVFSDPLTHRTLQIKGWDAARMPLEPGDAEVVEGYRAAFVERLKSIGFQACFVRALLGCGTMDLVAVAFTPGAAFNQTPGVQAGAPLEGPSR